MIKINLVDTKLITNIVNTLTTTNMNTPQTLLAHLRNAETNHIGFSYNINNGDSNPETGYMVSQKGYEQTAPQGCDLVAYGRNYFLLHAEQLADPTAYMGCWYNAGQFVFDISHNIETKDNAIEMGMTNEQDAIWDCASGSEYRLMREGDSPSHLVTIYYNDVFVSEEPNEIYANCPYVNMPIAEATRYADRMIENGDWDAYCIPELCNHEVKFTEVSFQRDGDAEKIYTKDELYAIMRSFVEDTRGDKPWVDADDEWFEQFTKTNTEVLFQRDGDEASLGEYKDADYQAMLDTLDVAMDEFSQIYNHSASNEFREYYEMHMNQLDNIINLINKLK